MQRSMSRRAIMQLLHTYCQTDGLLRAPSLPHCLVTLTVGHVELEELVVGAWRLFWVQACHTVTHQPQVSACCLALILHEAATCSWPLPLMSAQLRCPVYPTRWSHFLPSAHRQAVLTSEDVADATLHDRERVARALVGDVPYTAWTIPLHFRWALLQHK